MASLTIADSRYSGTQKFINELGIEVIAVEEITDYPSILGGRVKTLHPKVFGGILNRQDNATDVAEMLQYNIPQIDAVIVDLYPFEKTVASGASEADIIEKIEGNNSWHILKTAEILPTKGDYCVEFRII